MERYGDSLQIPLDSHGNGFSATGFIGEVMTLISPTFDVVMMHPLLAGMWGRPMSSFLGRKCYEEFEKRDAPCPHCPGRKALDTGLPQVCELEAVLDDDTRVPFLVRAYPVMGPQGTAVGFIEVHENIARRRLEEQHLREEHVLMEALLTTSNPNRVLRLALESASVLDGVTASCAVSLDADGTWEIVGHHGFSEAEVMEFGRIEPVSPGLHEVEQGTTMMHLPIRCGAKTVALLLVRLADDALTSSNSLARLDALASMASLALCRVRADRQRGDVSASMETLLAMLDAPVVCVDDSGRVTRWNHAAEGLFGWVSEDVVGSELPFEADDRLRLLVTRARSGKMSLQSSERTQCLCERRSGPPVSVVWTVARVQGVSNDGTAAICVADTAGSISVESSAPHAPAEDGERTVTRVSPGGRIVGLDVPRADTGAARRILVIRGASEDGSRLRSILESAGYDVEVCHSASEGIRLLETAGGSGDGFRLAVVEVDKEEVGGAVEVSNRLRRVDPAVPVILSCDCRVVGDTAHGFAGSICRPYEEASVISLVSQIRGGSTMTTAGAPADEEG